MNKRISLGAAIAIIFVVAALVFSITMNYATTNFSTRVTDLKTREQEYEKFAEIDRLVRLNYYGEINDPQLMDSVGLGYISGIGDKYATYYTAEEYKKLTQSDEGENVGIGAVIDISSDDFYLVVLEVYPDSPAQVAGIEPGDLIVKIDDTDLTRENSREMLEAINGPQGTQITLVTRRGSTENPPIAMTRRAVQLPIVTSKMLEDSTVGYIRISEFSENTYNQFNRELQKLTNAGAASLIFDVRDNKDLALNQRGTTRILDKLLPEGVLITAVYKDGSTEVLQTSDASEITLPMVALVNGGTSASAELFAQSIRDFEKGRIVGSTTAGKGIIQDTIKLSDGSAIMLTVATFQTKSGASFNETGIKPDFEVVMDVDWTTVEEAEDIQLVKAKEVAVAMERTASNANPGDENMQQTPAAQGTSPSTADSGEPESTASADSETSSPPNDDSTSQDEESGSDSEDSAEDDSDTGDGADENSDSDDSGDDSDTEE